MKKGYDERKETGMNECQEKQQKNKLWNGERGGKKQKRLSAVRERKHTKRNMYVENGEKRKKTVIFWVRRNYI